MVIDSYMIQGLQQMVIVEIVRFSFYLRRVKIKNFEGYILNLLNHFF